MTAAQASGAAQPVTNAQEHTGHPGNEQAASSQHPKITGSKDGPDGPYREGQLEAGASSRRVRHLLQTFTQQSSSPSQQPNKTSKMRRPPPHFTSLDALIDAYQNREHDYDKVRQQFEDDHGSIEEAYFTKNIRAGAVIVRQKKWRKLGKSYRMKLVYDGKAAAKVDPSFEETLWRARAEERESLVRLRGRPRYILVQTVYAVVIYLLGVLEISQKDKSTGGIDRINQAVKSARGELDRLRTFVKRSSRRSSLRAYLFGLPIGIISTFVLVLATDNMLGFLSGPETRRLLVVCLASGAIGAVVSVMARITRGQSLEVDDDQASSVTVLAGSFRPIIGAVFGAALFVLAQGGLLPLEFPQGDIEADQAVFFFGGLAFIAGFSERWAQDTIVRSAPTLPTADSEAGGRRKNETDDKEMAGGVG